MKLIFFDTLTFWIEDTLDEQDLRKNLEAFLAQNGATQTKSSYAYRIVPFKTDPRLKTEVK